MSPEELSSFQLDETLGGDSKVIHRKAIHRLPFTQNTHAHTAALMYFKSKHVEVPTHACSHTVRHHMCVHLCQPLCVQAPVPFLAFKGCVQFFGP